MLRRVLFSAVAIAIAVVPASAASAQDDNPEICAKAWVYSQPIDVPIGRCFPSDYGEFCASASRGNEDPVTVGAGVCVPSPYSPPVG